VTNLQEQIRTQEARRQLAEDQTKATSTNLTEARAAIASLQGQITTGSANPELARAAESVRIYVSKGQEANNEVRASLSSRPPVSRGRLTKDDPLPHVVKRQRAP
jgi:hypothetical protein